MANVYAVKTGNWSDTTVWNTAALPTSADDVYANTFTVTIDQDVTVKSIRNTSATGITAGGTYLCSTARTIDCSGGGGFYSGGGQLGLFSHSSGTTVTIRGTINSYTGNTTGFSLSSTGTTNYTGTNYGIGNSGGSFAVSAGHTLNHTGPINVSATNATGISTSSSGTINIIGDVTYNQVGLGGFCVQSTGSAVITVTGNIFAAYGGGGFWCYRLDGTSTLTLTGNVTSGNFPAIYGTSAGAKLVITSGSFISGSSGVLPFSISGTVKLAGAQNTEFRFAKSTGGTTSLWSSDVNSGAPSVANVRKGTTFGVSSEFTGTATVPAASDVLSGVPVDNTVGTARIVPDKWLRPL